ncbi:Cytochrome c heme lyase subunit CcmF [Nitrincola lacisaponensis]|uniref:Cytochrome c heme lyase subunit CcmF n=1 Tax=Nitrincola lacisaponensis TaxID=267850 RepID=A0A063Y2Q6_9GAMM|nr:heme lyase CcmF/NrfE family subunit [Nitrincola lacisaponensis]KDE40598.1 Cytochrome c heme lyase subunit CcmF [Nitrincola lacisaponensis]
MIPELGTFSTILALCLALILSVVPMVGAYTGNKLWVDYARPLAKGVFFFLTLAMALLAYSFQTDDFSVVYVAQSSNTNLPWYYKFSAIWGGHEGSLLLWVWIQAFWTLAVAIKSKNLPLDIVGRVLAVMGMITVAFLLFILFTSSPFERFLPNAPMEGADLNPLLQDFGLIVHPPALYMGYVGLSVAFSFAIAALLSGRLDAAWARWSRPWTNVAWAFLTLGIALGSWWAYYELGWGGWWFWDPVENASLMPWLVATALIHSLAVTEKRGVFKSWTVLLAISAFCLSLLGTFLVRSGVLTSVHAFATDPERGVFILGMLIFVIGGSLLLYAIRAGSVKSESSFALSSRESLLLVNNILFTVACAMVLIGTLYPLVMDALNLGKISVGPPYFNALFVPLMSLMVVFLGIAAFSRWKETPVSLLSSKLWLPGVLSVVAALATHWLYSGSIEFWVLLALLLSYWIVFTWGREYLTRLRIRKDWLANMTRQSRSYYGMLLGHLGVAVMIVGIAMVTVFVEHRDARMAPGDQLEFRGYTFIFDGARKVQGPNYVSDMARVRVLKDGQPFREMFPEKRKYTARSMVMTQVALDPGFTRDLYIAMGEELENGAWAMRLQFKPFVRWIWLGALLMTAGGLLAASDPRYRKQDKREAAERGSYA